MVFPLATLAAEEIEKVTGRAIATEWKDVRSGRLVARLRKAAVGRAAV